MAEIESKLVDCGTARHKGIGKNVRVVHLNGQYYYWDQDALDRKFGLGKYLFSPRFPALRNEAKQP